jgi:uncharacterized membrane protein YdfJ with MMPL/SSD domain
VRRPGVLVTFQREWSRTLLADALLVRCLLLPAALSLLGPHAWWVPASLGRLRRRITYGEELPPEVSAQAIADHR